MDNKVYMIYCNYHSEGANIYGIYSSESNAVSQLVKINNEGNAFMQYQIKEISIDEKIDFDIG